MTKVIITMICLRPYLSARTAPGIRTKPSTMAPMEPIKPIISGGAPSFLKNGDSNEKVIEKVKKTKSQLTMRVSRFPRTKENSALIFTSRSAKVGHRVLKTSYTTGNLHIFALIEQKLAHAFSFTWVPLCSPTACFNNVPISEV